MNKQDLPQAAVAKAKPNVKFDISTSAASKWQPGIKAADTQSENVISIYEEIGYDYWTDGGVTAQRIAAALRYIGDDQDVIVNINSPGGDVFEGLAIYNLLRNHGGKVTVRILGVAASAASVIAMAGDDIQIARAGFIMIHNCWSMAVGNQHDMRDAADYLAVFDDSAADIYTARTGQDKAKIIAMLDEETWMSGSQAIELGFADEYLSADQIEQTQESGAQASIRKLDQMLAKQGITRNERRKLIQSIKADKPCATSTSMPCATEQPATQDASQSNFVANGAATQLSSQLKGLLS